MEQREPTEEEITKVVGEMKGFVESLSKEMTGKQVWELLPLDIAAITSICLTQMFLSNPLCFTLKDDLIHLVTLVANSVMKLQEQKVEENSALEGIWGKE